MPMPWFTSKGQMVQTALAAVAAILAAVAAWQQVKNKQALSVSSLLFYALAALVIAVTVVANRRLANLRKAHASKIETLTAEHAVKVAALGRRIAD
jgi:hypothetical protein